MEVTIVLADELHARVILKDAAACSAPTAQAIIRRISLFQVFLISKRIIHSQKKVASA